MSRFAPMPDLLTTDRLRLRPWRDADAAAYRALWAERDPRSSRRILDGRPTVDELRGNIHRQLTSSARTGFGLLVVEDADRSEFLGYCGLVARDATPDEPELAYELLRAAHGRGYATEAARAVRDAAAATGRDRLWAGVRCWNTASLRVLAKLNFVDSGQVVVDAERGDLVLLTCDLTAVG